LRGAANAKLIFNGRVALIVGRVTGVERSSHETVPLFAEAFASGALLFGFNEFAGSLPGEHSDELAKARIGLRRIAGRHGVGGHEDHPRAFRRCTFPFCHDMILVPRWTIPLRTKTGLETG